MTGTSNNIFLGQGPNMVNQEIGVVTQAAGPVTFDVEIHGAIVKQPWWAYASAGTPQLQWVETFDA